MPAQQLLVEPLGSVVVETAVTGIVAIANAAAVD